MNHRKSGKEEVSGRLKRRTQAFTELHKGLLEAWGKRVVVVGVVVVRVESWTSVGAGREGKRFGSLVGWWGIDAPFRPTTSLAHRSYIGTAGTYLVKEWIEGGPCAGWMIHS